MTREEAIKDLTDLLPEEFLMDYAEAIKMGIEALERQCGDCISRKAAKRAVRNIYPVDTEYDCTLYDKVDVLCVLSDLPPVTAQPKMGKWIPCIDDDGDDYFLCSECRNGEYYRSDYCPHCGSKLDSTECF